MNNLTIRAVASCGDRRKFVGLPYRLYADDPFWVPPLRSDERALIDSKRNPALRFCDFQMWIALQNGKCVGRIAAIINKKWIEKNGKLYGRISRFDSIDNQDVASVLLGTAEEWLRQRGMTAVHGPLGFTNLDHQGILVEGFDRLPSVGSEYSKAYYSRLIEQCGYEKEQDWVEFRLTMGDTRPEKGHRVAQTVMHRYGLTCKSFGTKAELKQYAGRIFDLFNASFSQLFGAYEFPPDLCNFYISKYMPVLVPRYVKVVEDANGELAGFIIALPSLSAAMRKARGRLLPFGWKHIADALSRPTEMDLLLTGVRPEMQRLGVAAILMDEIWQTAHADGVRFVETTGMLEDNHVAIQMWKSFEHIQHKRKRCYMKKL